MWLGIILLVISALLIGTAIGFYLSSFTLIAGLTATIIQYTTLIGTAILVIKFATDYLKENAFDYSGVYFIQEIRIERQRKGYGVEETGRYNETAYFIRITKQRGRGRLEDCEGIITLDDKTQIQASWEGPNYQKYRSISIQESLKLFNISEDGKQILFFGNPESIDSLIPYSTITHDLDEEALNTKLSVLIGAKAGNPPKRPYTNKIRNIIKDAVDINA